MISIGSSGVLPEADAFYHGILLLTIKCLNSILCLNGPWLLIVLMFLPPDRSTSCNQRWPGWRAARRSFGGAVAMKQRRVI